MTRIGLIGGSGLDHWGSPVKEIDASTPYGDASAPLAVFQRHGHELLFLPRHGARHDIAPHRVNYRANIYALHEHGAAAVITVNAVGSMSHAMPPGSLAIPDQLVDYTWGREHSFSDAPGGELQHVEFAKPFTPAWRENLIQAAGVARVAVAEQGCIGVTQGPRLETSAEIQRLLRDGCDLVGMTSMPEAALARELNLAYATLAVVANFAAGLEVQPITQADIQNTLAGSMSRARHVIDTLLESL